MNIRKGAVWFLLLLASFWLTACEYDTNEVYNNPTENASAPVLSLVSLDLNQDTIFVYYDREINYEFISSNQLVKVVSFKVDGVVVDTVQSNKGSFSILYHIGAGLHTLQATMFTNSGSGSILEQLGGESFMFTRKWVVNVVDNSNAKLKPFYRDGYLTLGSVSYKNNNLSCYELYRIAGSVKKMIASGAAPQLADSCYLGEESTYELCAKTTSNVRVLMGKVTVAANPISLTAEPLTGKEFVFRWKKPAYYSAVAQILFNVDGQLLSTRTDFSDTLCVRSLIFGKKGSASVEFRAGNQYRFNSASNQSQLSTISYTMGRKFADENSTMPPVQASAKDFWYFKNTTAIARYSSETAGEISTINYPYTYGNTSNLTVSSSGKTICAKIGETYNVISLENGNLTGNRSLISYMGSTATRCPVSDAGIILVNKTAGGFVLLNMTTGAVVAQMTAANAKGLCISSDGKYVIAQTDACRLYKLVDGSLSVAGSWSTPIAGSYYFSFDPADVNQFITWNKTTFSVYKTTDASLVRTYPVTASEILSVDPYANEILFMDDKNLNVYNYSTGVLVYSIPYSMSSVQAYYPGCYILVNGCIISKNGLYYQFR